MAEATQHSTLPPRNLLVAQLLQRISQATHNRDRKLAELKSTLEGTDKVDEWVETIEEAQTRQVQHCAESAAIIASRLSQSAQQAEQSSKVVKDLHQLSGRVQSALSICKSVIQQREAVSLVTAALEAKNYQLAGKFIRQYDEVMGTLQGSGFVNFTSPMRKNQTNSFTTEETGSSISEDYVMVDGESNQTPEDIINGARSSLEVKVCEELQGATSKAKVLELTSVLADMGRKDFALDTYSNWVSDKVKAELDEMVDGELLKLDQNSSSNSHLWLVSKVLDHSVAAAEKEEEHLKKSFGERSVAEMLRKLHLVCTKACDRIVSDFLKRRSLRPQAGQSAGGTGAKGSPSLSYATAAGDSTLQSKDPRVLDGILEDIAHLISCYHLYLQFVEGKVKAATKVHEPEPEPHPSTHSHRAPHPAPAAPTGPSLSKVAPWLQDKTLNASIDQLLSIYGVIQRDYLHTVFQACCDILSKKLDTQTEESSSMFSALFGGGSSVKEAVKDERGKKSGSSSSLPSSPVAAPGVPIALPQSTIEINFIDDVFHVVLLTLRRATQTRSIVLAKSSILEATAVIGGRLLEVVQKRLNAALPNPQTPMNVPPSAALRWIDAGGRVAKYILRLGEEVNSTARSAFENPTERETLVDPLRKLTEAVEQYNDLLKSALKKVATALAQSMLRTADIATRFGGFSYVLTEQGLTQSELNDPWAQATAAGWSKTLDDYKPLFAPETNDTLVSFVVDTVVSAIEDIVRQKEFDQYGGLQLDKDIRVIREMFNEKVDSPLREKFMRLNGIASVLVVDRAADAVEWHSALGQQAQKKFSLQDVVNFLQKRVDISDEEIRKAVERR